MGLIKDPPLTTPASWPHAALVNTCPRVIQMDVFNPDFWWAEKETEFIINC